MPEFTAISHLDLTVRDLDTSARWYENTLGFTRLFRSDADERSSAVLMHAGSGLILGLVQHRDAPGTAFDERHAGLDHLAFAVTDRAELDSWQERLAELGVTHSPVTDDPSGMGTALVFRDPDNIQLEMWWMRPQG
jgi:glyoxylase I family protein